MERPYRGIDVAEAIEAVSRLEKSGLTNPSESLRNKPAHTFKLPQLSLCQEREHMRWHRKI